MFKTRGSHLLTSDKPLNLVDTFTYLGINISSTESDVSIHLAKMCNATDTLSTIRKYDHSDKIKPGFFQVLAVSILLYGSTT